MATAIREAERVLWSFIIWTLCSLFRRQTLPTLIISQGCFPSGTVRQTGMSHYKSHASSDLSPTTISVGPLPTTRAISFAAQPAIIHGCQIATIRTLCQTVLSSTTQVDCSQFRTMPSSDQHSRKSNSAISDKPERPCNLSPRHAFRSLRLLNPGCAA